MNTPESKSFINQKTKRGPNDTDELEAPSKKYKSAESKKTMDLNLKEVEYFIAKLEPKYENIIFNEDKKLIGEKLNFKYRQEKAQKLIDKVFQKKKYDIKDILDALEYDNTNKRCIYALLDYNKKENDEEQFKQNLNKYKYCITQKFNIQIKGKENAINLNQLYEIKLLIKELEELPNCKKNEEGTIKDLRNSVVEFFTNYYYIADNINKLLPLLGENELEKILTVHFYKDGDNNYKMNYRNEEKLNLIKNAIKDKRDKDEVEEKDIKDSDKENDINLEGNAEELIQSINNYLSEFLYYEDFKDFQMNQPIDYRSNLTLYYNYIIWSLFKITAEVNESENYIFLIKERILSYKSLSELHDILFDLYFDKGNPFNDIMNRLLQFLILALSSGREIDLEHIHNNINLKKNCEFINDDESAEEFRKKLNKKYTFLNAKFIDDKKEIIELQDKNTFFPTKIEIICNNYTKESIYELPKNINWLWENINFEAFQSTNFFLKEDIDYLKYIIKRILSSKLFKQIYEKFNNIKSVADYYFNKSENIDDYISRIIFLPYKVKDIKKYATTDRRLLSVLVSGFPEKEIDNLKQYRIYRILELCLREIILSDHEPCHFIKAACNIITEGKVARNTSHESNIESGFFFEQILFGWDNDLKCPINLKELNLLKNEYECKNLAIKNKKIDLITAIVLLNPDLYEIDLDYFRNIVFNLTSNDLETFSFPLNVDQKYKNYIDSVIGCKNIKNFKKCNYSINASMGCYFGFSVDYIRVNHNIDRYDY